jgi:transcriptional regulator with XRE-family HTH domain
MNAREAFGPTLQQQRQRRGVTLESIARTTKISRSLLTALERSDVSRWPGGIYRRSYFREYAAAIGLPPEPALHEFLRLFPEPGSGVAPAEEAATLRLTLVGESRWKAPAKNTLAALLDGGAVLLAGYTVAAALDGHLWTTVAVAGLAWHALAMSILGKSPGSWAISATAFTRRTPHASAIDAIAELRRDWLTGLLQPAKGGTEGQAVT